MNRSRLQPATRRAQGFLVAAIVYSVAVISAIMILGTLQIGGLHIPRALELGTIGAFWSLLPITAAALLNAKLAGVR